MSRFLDWLCWHRFTWREAEEIMTRHQCGPHAAMQWLRRSRKTQT